MSDLGCLLEEVETRGNWSQKDIEKYFVLSGEEEYEDYGDGDFCVFRDYRLEDDVGDLIDKIGDYSISELWGEGYDVQVMEEDGNICGMIATRDEEGAQYIGAIAVDRDCEGKGFMGDLIAAVYDGRPITSKVSEGNSRARGAFEKHGFKADGIINGWQLMILE